MPKLPLLNRLFAIAFLAFLMLDFLSVFSVFGVSASTWDLTFSGGTVGVKHVIPVLVDLGRGFHVALSLPSWTPLYFDIAPRSDEGYFLLALPIWPFTLASAFAAMIMFHFAVRRKNLCAECKYDISSVGGNVCPECGNPVVSGLSRLRVKQSLRIFLNTHKSVIAFSLILVGVGAALVLGMRLLIWMTTIQTTIIVPNGYVGSILFVQDEKGVAPEGGWGRYLYRIPETGVLRVTDIDAVKNYPSTPSTQIDFACREQDGTEIQTRPPWASEKKWFTIEGPYGRPGVSIARIGIGIAPGRLPRELRISPEQEKELRDNGIPADFVAPHRFLKKGEILQADP